VKAFVGLFRRRRKIEPRIIDPNPLSEMAEEIIRSLNIIPGLHVVDGCAAALEEISKQLPKLNNNVKKNPAIPDAYFERGRIFHHYGECMDYAIEDFTTAIELAEERKGEVAVEIMYVLRGQCYAYRSWGRSRTSPPRDGDFERAVADFNRAIELDPDLPAAYNARAFLHEKNGRIEEAIKDYQRALVLLEKWGGEEADINGIKQKLAEMNERVKDGDG